MEEEYKILDMYIIDNIISYLNINESFIINKKYHNIAKNNAKKKVIKIIKFYKYNKLRLEMLFEYESYEDNEWIYNYYILFYPKEYRIGLMYNSLIYLNTTYRNTIRELYYSSVNNPETLKKNFNMFIKLLNINELHYLGW
jgi:hypothetical protein